MSEIYIKTLILALLGIQFGSFLLLILLKQIFRKLPEKIVAQIANNMILSSILVTLALAFFLIQIPQHHYIFDIGTWFKTFEGNYEIIFILDSLSVIYSLFSMIMIGVILVFSRRYLHKEAGYFRFYLFMNLFTLGLVLISFAGNMEITIIGWEFVGIASILLISFFNYRKEPVKNALWVFINYRICDIGLFAALLVMHAFLHRSNFDDFGNNFYLTINAQNAPEILGFLILFAVIGKSALVPLSTWLPRAMEGPTPSSAIFYGAVSIHFGPFLLLRNSSLIHSSPAFAASVFGVGMLTAIICHIIARGQTDVKSAAAYESVAQVGIITSEIALGLDVIAILHIVGHSCFRVMQILRAPSIIQDLRHIEQLLGHSLDNFVVNKKYDHRYGKIYNLILERGFMENFLQDYFLYYFLAPFRAINAAEKSWRKWLKKVTHF